MRNEETERQTERGIQNHSLSEIYRQSDRSTARSDHLVDAARLPPSSIVFVISFVPFRQLTSDSIDEQR